MSHSSHEHDSLYCAVNLDIIRERAATICERALESEGCTRYVAALWTRYGDLVKDSMPTLRLSRPAKGPIHSVLAIVYPAVQTDSGSSLTAPSRPRGHAGLHGRTCQRQSFLRI
jgi:hypothetical protein